VCDGGLGGVCAPHKFSLRQAAADSICFSGIRREIDSDESPPLESPHMPLYEYLCKKCGHRFEQIRKFSDKQLRKCPECGGVIEQVITAPSVQFKGSGFYQTDYKKTSSGSAESSSSSSSEGDGSSKETKDGKESKDAKTTKTDDKPKSEPSSKKQKKE
jgi:putative FmdB family regulatory protein